MLQTSNLGGGEVGGIVVPTGDPGSLHQAAAAWRKLAAALEIQAMTIGGGSETAINMGGWTGGAAESFAGSAEKLIGSVREAMATCNVAQGQLDALGNALSHVQSVTAQAQVDYSNAETEYTTQSEAATRAGNAARTATQNASSSPHPSTAAEYTRQATAAQQDQKTAEGAAGQAQQSAGRAQAQAKAAIAAYDHIADQVRARLQSAAGELHRPTVDHGWAADIVKWGELAFGWASKLNDGGATGGLELEKDLDVAITKAADKTFDEMQRFLADGTLPKDSSTFDKLLSRYGDSDNPWLKALGWTPLDEKAFPLLSKVPALAALFTAGDIALDLFVDHDGVVKSIGEPVGNLAVTTGIAEGTTTALSSLAGADGAIVIGSMTVPVAGEVVVVAVVAVGGTIVVDKVVSYLWDHGGEHDVVEVWHDEERGATRVATAVSHVATTVADREAAGAVKVWHGVESGASTVSHGATEAWHGVESGASTVAHGATTVFHGVEHGVEGTPGAIAHGASSVWHALGL